MNFILHFHKEVFFYVIWNLGGFNLKQLLAFTYKSVNSISDKLSHIRPIRKFCIYKLESNIAEFLIAFFSDN
jgi:hypothetical protein